jgi:hypothetical protein
MTNRLMKTVALSIAATIALLCPIAQAPAAAFSGLAAKPADLSSEITEVRHRHGVFHKRHKHHHHHHHYYGKKQRSYVVYPAYKPRPVKQFNIYM